MYFWVRVDFIIFYINPPHIYCISSLVTLIRTHPISGEKSLYINPNRIDHITGFDEHDSDELLDELYHFSFQSKFQYNHSYKKGDLVIWDNRCTMHKANSEYDITQLRVMHRVMLEGEEVY